MNALLSAMNRQRVIIGLLLCVALLIVQTYKNLTLTILKTPPTTVSEITVNLEKDFLTLPQDIQDSVLFMVFRGKIGREYKWGTFDCSKAIQEVYQEYYHIAIPRTAKEQANAGVRVQMEEVQTGDLIYMENEKGQAHIGFYISGHVFHNTPKIGPHFQSTNYTWFKRRIKWATRIEKGTVQP